MRISFIFFLCILSSFSLVAQKTITGKVLTNENTPLEGAAVYLNNTSIGTTTDENGEFELTIKEGTYDLIASFLGFETAQFSLDTQTVNQSITFKLSPKANMLNEVVVSNKRRKISPEDRAYFLSQFRRSFLGKTNLSFECKILNEDDIDFDYNPLSGLLEAFTSKPIEIDHKGLGYKIYYDLVHFELTPKTVTFLGYTRYENKRGSKRKQRKWKEKRKVAYNGSLIHFLQSVMNNEVKEEGFIVDHFKRIPNPARPSDSVIALARAELRTVNKLDEYIPYRLTSNQDLNDKKIRDKILKRSLEKFKSFPVPEVIKKNDTMRKKFEYDMMRRRSLKFETLKDEEFIVTKNERGMYEATAKSMYNPKRDPLQKILNKARLKRVVDQLIKQDLSTKEFSENLNGTYYLKFPYYLKIKYMKESEEDNYRRGSAKLDYQVSMVTLYVDRSKIDPIGVLVNPLDIFLEGYWSYEKIGDALPLDYDPDEQ